LSDIESLPDIPHTSDQPHNFTQKHFEIFVESERIYIWKFVALNNEELALISCVLKEPYFPSLHVHMTS
jgi:hypothetical protein